MTFNHSKISLFPFSRANDIDKATAAKFKVEQKQREEAKVRKDENSAFTNKVISRRLAQSNFYNFFHFSSFFLVLQKRRRRLDLLQSIMPQTYIGTK